MQIQRQFSEGSEGLALRLAPHLSFVRNPQFEKRCIGSITEEASINPFSYLASKQFAGKKTGHTSYSFIRTISAATSRHTIWIFPPSGALYLSILSAQLTQHPKDLESERIWSLEYQTFLIVINNDI